MAADEERGFRICVMQGKGGSGKTEFAKNLAAAFAEEGEDVDVADCDPQANSSRRLAAEVDEGEPSISEAIKASATGAAWDAYRPCGWPEPYASRIRVLPAHFDLENRLVEAGLPGAHLRLRKALTGCDTGIISLLDCAPSLAHLTQMALASADVILIPVEPEKDGVKGALRVIDFVQKNAADLGNPDLRIAGVVPSRVRAELGAHAEQLARMPELFGEYLWADVAIPERTAIKEAADEAIPLRASKKKAAHEVADVFTVMARRLLTLRAELAA
ncbi:ParA family protein [Kitasatospora cineracea]|uniref:Chromosome partitioning protein n=1 Tax=Kitasatospora cineracea TaxID=88074 RepID=A0A3N4RE16_9ACTN|nr:ParA family protein [Kitasatospora cineracea]RPE26587.1 chromosome partitioning protein [Kitasatospora cineracea]